MNVKLLKTVSIRFNLLISSKSKNKLNLIGFVVMIEL